MSKDAFRKLTLEITESMFRRLDAERKARSFLSVQELMRDILGHHLEAPKA